MIKENHTLKNIDSNVLVSGVEKINIVFCFDEKQWMPAGVSIASLLCSSNGKCSYNIYCITSENVTEMHQNHLRRIVRENDPHSAITFVQAGSSFNNAFISRHLSQATYFRLKIHELLPHLDKVIYCDVDTIFCKDLMAMNKIDIGDNLLGGILDLDLLRNKSFKQWYHKNEHNHLNFNSKALFGHHINAGILIMNLQKIREEALQDKWQKLLGYKFYLHDQDILNISCYKRIKYIDPKFNVLVHALNNNLEECKCNAAYKSQIKDAIQTPAIIHYTADKKPWLCEPNRFFEVWWDMASKTHLYKALSFNYLRLNLQNLHKDCRPKSTKHYLLGFIPFLVSKSYKNKIKYYLFGFILIFKITKKL